MATTTPMSRATTGSPRTSSTERVPLPLVKISSATARANINTTGSSMVSTVGTSCGPRLAAVVCAASVPASPPEAPEPSGLPAEPPPVRAFSRVGANAIGVGTCT